LPSNGRVSNQHAEFLAFADIIVRSQICLFQSAEQMNSVFTAVNEVVTPQIHVSRDINEKTDCRQHLGRLEVCHFRIFFQCLMANCSSVGHNSLRRLARGQLKKHTQRSTDKAQNEYDHA
jgi:hypothetical protein